VLGINFKASHALPISLAYTTRSSERFQLRVAEVPLLEALIE
jgi:hypothetical protein